MFLLFYYSMLLNLKSCCLFPNFPVHMIFYYYIDNDKRAIFLQKRNLFTIFFQKETDNLNVEHGQPPVLTPLILLRHFIII